jgi:AraC family ethanolamine operon transcriptional activator
MPFKAGRIHRAESRDADEIAASILHSDLDLLQLSADGIHAVRSIVQGERLQVHLSSTQGRWRTRGTIVPGCTSLAIADGPAWHLMHGARVDPLDVLRTTNIHGVDQCVSGHLDLSIVEVEAGLLERATAALFGKNFPAPTCRRLRLRDLDAKKRFLERLRRKFRAALRWPSLLADAQTRSLWEDAILYDLLSATLTDDADPQKPSQRMRLAASAEEWLRDNAHRPFSILEMTRALGCSKSPLFLAFEERFGVSPMAYMKAVRLQGARRELKRASTATTVTEVAIRWGFVHLGRFSADYRSFFGEPPSSTLALALPTAYGHRERMIESPAIERMAPSRLRCRA